MTGSLIWMIDIGLFSMSQPPPFTMIFGLKQFRRHLCVRHFKDSDWCKDVPLFTQNILFISTKKMVNLQSFHDQRFTQPFYFLAMTNEEDVLEARRGITTDGLGHWWDSNESTLNLSYF